MTCRQELPLARSSSLYVTVDVPAHRIAIKARGVLLREFPMKKALWVSASMDTALVAVMAVKHPEIAPVEIRPLASAGAGESHRHELGRYVDVSGMPHRYTVVLAQGLSVLIHSEREGALLTGAYDSLAGFARLGVSRVLRWIQSWLGSPASTVWVEVSAEDAQALYWALVPPMKVLIIPEAC